MQRDREFAALEREENEKILKEMKEFSKLQKISYAKMAQQQEDREKRLKDQERVLEQKLREAESLAEEAKRAADRRDYVVAEDDPDIAYYDQCVEYAEGRLHPSSANRSHTRSWETLDDDLIDLHGFSDPE